MKNDKLLEELRAQRELIRKHLQWLDQKISSLDKDAESGSTSNQEGLPQVRENATAKLIQAVNADGALPEEKNTEPGVESSKYQSPIGNDLMKAKVGCLILLTLGILLFLFSLFGLPYLIYN